MLYLPFSLYPVSSHSPMSLIRHKTEFEEATPGCCKVSEDFYQDCYLKKRLVASSCAQEKKMSLRDPDKVCLSPPDSQSVLCWKPFPSQSPSGSVFISV